MDIKRGTIVTFLLLLLAAGCGGGGNGGQDTASSHITAGWNNYKISAYDSAISEFNKALTLNPTDSEASKAYCGLGWCYRQKGNCGEAITKCDLAIGRNSSNADAYLAKASAYLSKGGGKSDFEKAVTAANQVLIINPSYSFPYDSNINYLDVYSLLAVAHLNLGNYLEARNYVDIVLAKDPNNITAQRVDEILKSINQ